MPGLPWYRIALGVLLWWAASVASPVLAAKLPAASAGDGEVLELATADKRSFYAYRVGPIGAKRGILLLHPAYGLNAYTIEWADRLAAEGFRVIAPDLYDGELAEDDAAADRLQKNLNQRRANAKLVASLRALTAPGRKLIAMGWGFGGTQALNASLAAPYFVSATVIYDSPAVRSIEPVRAVKGAVLVVAHADVVSAKDKRAFQAAMRARRSKLRLFNYTTEPVNGNENYLASETAELAWRETEAFLKKFVR